MTGSFTHDSIERIIFDNGLRIQSVEIHSGEDAMSVHLNNGHLLNVRLCLKVCKWLPVNHCNAFTIIANGTGIHWPQLDEDLSLQGFFKRIFAPKNWQR